MSLEAFDTTESRWVPLNRGGLYDRKLRSEEASSLLIIRSRNGVVGELEYQSSSLWFKEGSIARLDQNRL